MNYETEQNKDERKEYQTEADKLFKKWSEKNSRDEQYPYKAIPAPDSFSRDGIVCPEVYFNCGLKVLYICREENLSRKENSDGYMRATGIINHIQNIIGKKAKPGLFYNNIIRMQGLLTTGAQEKALNLEKLKEIAIINLNKRGGSGSCNQIILKNYTEKYAEEIRSQIKLIQPDVILCCGTFDLVQKYVLKRQDKIRHIKSPTNEALQYYNYPIGKKNSLVLEYYHPSARNLQIYSEDPLPEEKINFSEIADFVRKEKLPQNADN